MADRHTYVRDARTRARRASYRLVTAHQETAHADVRWLVGYDAADLLRDLLDAAERLVPLLNDDQPEEVEALGRNAKALAAALRARALAPKLENVTGRTAEEAAAFRARAAELRGGVSA